MIKKITIIGWTSWFWEWLAKFLKKDFWEINIIIIWRNAEKWEKTAKKIWVIFSNNSEKEVKNSDIVIFSTPISQTEKIIKNIWPKINPNAIVADVTSIKWFPAKTMKNYCPKTCIIIPIHPMFWPSISSIASQVFVLCPEEKIKKENSYIFLKKYIEKKWWNIIETSPKEHDKIMAVVQWLTHFSLFTIWETINRLWINVKFSQQFVSPIYKILLASVSRYMNQNPALYADIQINNEEVIKVQKVFKEVRDDFSNFVKNKDKKSFIETIEKTKKHFSETAENGQKYTDKIIFLISKQIEKIEENIWKIIEFENIYSRKKISWKIEKLDQNNWEIIFENWEKININEWIC